MIQQPTPQRRFSHRKADVRLKCIWLGRSIPFPPNSGDRVYTLGLLRALVRHADIRYFGIGDEDALGQVRTYLPEVQWVAVRTSLRSRPTSLLSKRPYVSARHSPPLMVATVRSALTTSTYDFVVLDQYALGWVIEECHDILTAKERPVAYLAHNYEAALAKATATAFRGNPIKRFLLHENADKIARMERILVGTADVVTAISSDDASALARLRPKRPPVVISPGVDAASSRSCTISENTPRALIIVGSFHWVPKQINLAQFLSGADSTARERRIRLDIVGDVPARMSRELSSKYGWVRFLGFVERLDALMSAYRLALNIENTGGGFKLKILTYVAAGLPVAALGQSLTGVPPELRKCMIVCDTPADLLARAADAMDDISDLRRRTADAKQCVDRLFNWEQSAQHLAGAVLGSTRHLDGARQHESLDSSTI